MGFSLVVVVTSFCCFSSGELTGAGRSDMLPPRALGSYRLRNIVSVVQKEKR
jgi:hypothetical protein